MKLRELDRPNGTVRNLAKEKEIDELERWFRFYYPDKLNEINRHVFLGIKPEQTRYSLELEAYKKENRLRQLKGLELLPEIKVTNLL